MNISGSKTSSNLNVRRVILTTGPLLHPFSNAAGAPNNYYCLGLDMKGFQIEIDLQAYPAGINLQQIAPDQVWWVEKRTSLYRLYLYAGIFDSTTRQINSTDILPQYSSTYGNYYDTTNQIAVASGTPYTVTFNNDAGSQGFTLVSGSRITPDAAGVYIFSFSAQFAVVGVGGNSTYNASIWARINGADTPWSSGEISIYAKSPYALPSWNFIQQMSAGDFMELVWAVDTPNQIYAAAQPSVANGYAPAWPTPPYGPSIPSWTMTVSQA